MRACHYLVLKPFALLNIGSFRALIPDLYKGKIGITAEEANHHMENLGTLCCLQKIFYTFTVLFDNPSSSLLLIIVLNECFTQILQEP